MTGITYVLFGDSSPLIKAFAAAYGALGALTDGLKGALGAITDTDGSLGALFSSAVKGAADMETVSVAFETLTRSAGLAGQLLGDLKKFAADTPFEFPEVANAGKLLLAFGSNAATVKDELRTLGDVGSLVGAPIGELSELYGKMRVQGRLFAQDVNQLTGRGIPVIQEFARQFGVTTNKVQGLVESGKIGFPQLEKAFTALTSEGGIFFEGMKKQSQTFNGLWSTMKDNIGETLREFGKPILAQLKPILEGAIAQSGQLVAYAQQWGRELAVVLATMRELFDTGKLWDSLGLGLKLAFVESLNFLAKALLALAAGFGGAIFGAIHGAFSDNSTILDDMSKGAQVVFTKAMGDLRGVDFIDSTAMRSEFLNSVTPAMDKVQRDMAAAGKLASDAIANTTIPQLAKLEEMQKPMAPLTSLSNRIAQFGGSIAGINSLGKQESATTQEIRKMHATLKMVVTNTKPKKDGPAKF